MVDKIRLHIAACVCVLLLQVHCSQGELVQFLGEQPFRAYASRSTTTGKVLYQAFASSSDASGITYTLQQSSSDQSSSRHFQLQPVTGELVLSALFSSLEEHTIVIEARSTSNTTAQASLVVVVLTEQDTTSRFERESYSLSVYESQALNQPFSVLRAFSLARTSTSAEYSIVSDTSAGSFTINATNGLLSVTRALDREEIDQYSLIVHYTHSNGLAEAAVTINVLDTNDNPPQFAEMIYTISMAEGTGVSTSILTVEGSDRDTDDNAELQYSLLSSLPADDFTLDLQTGVLSVSSELDYERTSQYILTVAATDGGRPALTSTVLVVVSVGNEDDECPRFDSPLYVVNINASQLHSDLQLVTVQARDPDGFGGITYTLVSGNVNGMLSLNGQTGEVTLANVDSSTRGQYSLNISASDGGCSGMSFVWVEIRIVAANVHTPVFTTPCDATLAENSPSGTEVVTLAATDGDLGLNGEITYSLLNTSLFSIDPIGGVVRTNQNASSYDREVQPHLHVGVIASDGGLKQVYCLLNVTLLDTNDNTPTFILSEYTVTLALDTPPFSSVATMVAFDPDSGSNRRLTYTLTSSQPTNFTIDPTTAEITTIGRIDLQGSYSLDVSVTDAGDPMLSSTATLAITLVEGSGFPVFQRPYYNATLCENVPVGKHILTVNASSSPTYSVTPMGSEYSSNDLSTFILSDNRLRVGSQVLVDFERLNSRGSFLFPVFGSNEVGTSFTTVEVFVIDLDDNSPDIDSGYSFSLAENQPVGVVVTQILAHDADSGTNGEIAYRLTSSSPHFAISADGVVTSSRVFDFEAGPVSGELLIELYNPNPAMTLDVITEECGFQVFLDQTSQSVSVRWEILDLNDNPPVFNASVYAVSVSEGQQTPRSILTFNASDVDMDSAGLDFFITSGDSEGRFVVDADTLMLIRQLDYETTPSYNLTVQVTDGLQTSCTQCVAIVMVTVIDVDDEPPVFSAPSYAGEVVEGADIGNTVVSVSASDVDSPRVTYSLSWGAWGFFSILESGDIVVSGELDREEFPDGVVSFLVIAEGGAGVIATADVNIVLLDVNDHAPRFLEVFSGRVWENMTTGSEGIVITQVVAVDPDRGGNGTVTYAFMNGTENGFQIDSISGVITAHMEYDRETNPSFLLTVVATDAGDPAPLSSSTQVVVEVEDINDNAPFFPFPYMFARIFEGGSRGDHVVTVPASDLDTGTNADVTFELVSSTLPNEFTLDTGTGEVLVGGVLDYEIPLHRSAKLRIAIRDPLFQGEVEGELCITLLDRNDNQPRVTSVMYNPILAGTFVLAETFPPGQTLVTIVAVDDDEGSNGELDYAIVSGDERGDFSVSSTGQVTTTRLLDYETTSSYALGVSVSDRGTPSLSTEVQVEFEVQDINDNAPSFSQSVYSVSVTENTDPMDSVLQVAATDPDTSIGGIIRYYRIVAGNVGSRFVLNETSGVLGTTSMFDREERDSYMLVITANDMGADSLTGTASIEVSITDINDNPSRSDGVMRVFIYDDGGLEPRETIGTVYFRDPDTTNDFRSCMFDDRSTSLAFGIFSLDGPNCVFGIGESIPEEGTYMLSLTGRDGVHTSASTSIVVTVERIDNAMFPPDGVVTVTINATAEEYYGEELDVTMPTLIAQHVGVARTQLNIMSLQPGYHAPLTHVDLTFSVTTTSGDLMEPDLIVNRLFLSRDNLLVGRRGIVSVPTNPCSAEPCSNQAKCITTRTTDHTQPALSSNQYVLLAPVVALGYECVCVAGTAGESCEVNYDDCYSDPCMYGVSCTDAVQGYTCDCPEGTSGTDCSFNQDECTSEPCLNDAQCTNGFNTYICQCLPGYYGEQCQFAHFQVSPACDFTPCLGGGTCSPGRDGFTCLCPEGRAGPLCGDVVEVQGGCVGNPCHNGSTCEDTREGPLCHCSTGFTGPFCRWPLNNCELEPCGNGGTCEVGLYGSYLCTCAVGFEGEDCTQSVSPCESQPCLNGGRCSYDLVSGVFTCQCTRQFTGLFCDTPIFPPDLCVEGRCPASSSSNCTSGRDDVTCSCLPGFYGDDCSSTSSPLPPLCAANPCQHGGSCQQDQADAYTCSCSVGFTGTDCEVDIDDCASGACPAGSSTCRDGVGGFVCDCAEEGVTGDVCQVSCPNGHVGEFCEVVVPQCSLSSCSNGGTCSEEDGGGFVCACPDSHTGTRCELSNNCSVTLCLNGGTCADLATGGSECTCRPGYDGARCQLLTATFSGSSNQNSYRAYRPVQLEGRGTIAMEFATTSRHGLLLYSTQYQDGESRDLVAVEIVEGLLTVGVALGSGAEALVVMGNSVYVSDGLWHQVSIATRGKVSGGGEEGRGGGRRGGGRRGGGRRGGGGGEGEGGGGEGGGEGGGGEGGRRGGGEEGRGEAQCRVHLDFLPKSCKFEGMFGNIKSL